MNKRTDLMNMARGIGGKPSAEMFGEKFDVGFKPPENTTILACPTCGSRHGGEIADTLHVSWRCKKCKKYIYGKVTNSQFILMAATDEELST